MTALVFPPAPVIDQIFPTPSILGIPTWQWNGAMWELLAEGGGGGGTLDGDVTGALGANTVARIQTRNVAATAPTNDQVLTWSTTPAPGQWVPRTPALTLDLATAAQLRAMTADKVINTTGLTAALAFQNYGNTSGTLAPNFLQFVNARWYLAGNLTLQFPTVNLTPIIGRSGLLLFDILAASTISYAYGYTFDKMQIPAISTGLNTANLLSYSILDVDWIHLTLVGGGIT